MFETPSIWLLAIVFISLLVLLFQIVKQCGDDGAIPYWKCELKFSPFFGLGHAGGFVNDILWLNIKSIQASIFIQLPQLFSELFYW